MRLIETNAGTGPDRTGDWRRGLVLALVLTFALEQAFGVTSERIGFVNVVRGALLDYDWPDLLEKVSAALP